MDAMEITCSTNGSLFTTSSAKGVIQMWDIYICALIYQVIAAFQTSEIAPPPDGRRVYDIRGPIINIW
ncbi:hypothetical protein BJ878DRAFT_504661 [Calycina marina]|uniref:Uncharacterized protein n=1 Tax=Calycina marina TaxID=1763456 RepID=A0A9P8CF45_9HELO|nr:hypothetical protein BJ878DRAFT_504661 [Calycina marina]